jgi:hypothetical protein
MEIGHSMRDGCIVVRLAGQINLFTAPQVQRVLLKDLAERHYGIVCDLAEVESIDPVCAAVFSTVANHPSTDWPATSVLLCGARPAWPRCSVGWRCPGSCRCAPRSRRRSTGSPPGRPTCGTSCPGPSTATAPAAARLYVRDVLRYWRLALPGDGVIYAAELLADELVTNAVVHARAPLRLRLELRGDLLHLAVRDGSPRLLRPVADDLELQAGRGLRLVERLATAWGCASTPTARPCGAATAVAPPGTAARLRCRRVAGPAAPRRRSRP